MRFRIERALRGRRAAFFVVSAPIVFAAIDGGHTAALPAAPGPRGATTPVQAAIESQPVCIGSSVASAGTLSGVLYYRAVALAGGQIAVGYFAFFSEERPWGNNWMTWSVLPALAIDSVYSRALLVAPGLQRALYGAGDVEGVGAIYDVTPDGSLRLDHARVEDRTEHTVTFSRDDAFALDPERIIFYADVWSHQLGGRGARSRSDLAYLRCYQGDAIRPLPEAVARSFRLEERAMPAHVERLAASRLDVAEPARDEMARSGS